MEPIYETSTLGMWIKVYADRVEFKSRALWHPVESIPIGQIASIKKGPALLNQITLTTSGGQEHKIPTSKKDEVADAIYAAQAALRGPAGAVAMPASAADEIAKLADLRDRGVITAAEFEAQKARLLTGARPQPSRASAAADVKARATAPKRGPWKTILLAVGAVLIALVVIGFAVGPEEKQRADEPTTSTTSPSPARAAPSNDADLLLSRCGPPDKDDSTAHDTPRPPIVTRMITYRKAALTFAYSSDGPPFDGWKLLGVTDDKRKAAVKADQLEATLKKRLPCLLAK